MEDIAHQTEHKWQEVEIEMQFRSLVFALPFYPFWATGAVNDPASFGVFQRHRCDAEVPATQQRRASL